MSDGGKGTALVTGASSGLGAEFAKQLAQRGYGLVLVARRKDRLDALAEELKTANGVTAEVIEADLSMKKGVSAVVDHIKQEHVSVLVNNAGFGTTGEFTKLPISRELDVIDVNVAAVTQLSYAAAGPMVERKRGTIINLGSVGSFQPVPYMSTYAATKAYILNFSEGLHEELKPHGVTVTCVCPGVVYTEFQETAGLSREKMPGMGIVTPEKVVADALKGAARNKAVVIPGAMNQAAAQMTRFAPRFLIRKVSGALFRDAGA